MAARTFSSKLRPLLSSRQVKLLPRGYHSYDHPAPSGPFNSAEEAILSPSLSHVPLHGFTQQALTLGAKDAGYLDVSTNLFPRGPYSLVHYHLHKQRLALADHASIIHGKDDTTGRELGTGAKVKALAWQRLLANESIIQHWQQALSLSTSPSNLHVQLAELHALSDEIWYLAGDVSVDTSWYTKRATLSAIYASTELFMTTDRSDNFKETRDFLNRRLDDSRVLGGMARSIGQWIGFTGSATVNVLRSKGVRI